MKISQIDNQIKLLQKKKREKIKKEEEHQKKELFQKVIGSNYGNILKVVNSNPKAEIALYVDGKPLEEYLFLNFEVTLGN